MSVVFVYVYMRRNVTHPEKKTRLWRMRRQRGVGGRMGVRMRSGAPCMDRRGDIGGCGWNSVRQGG